MKISLRTTMALMIFCTLAGNSNALERFDVITTLELKKMLEQRAAGKTDFTLVNSLDEIVYRDSSIPGSINIPWVKVHTSLTEEKLGPDKDKLVVTY